MAFHLSEWSLRFSGERSAKTVKPRELIEAAREKSPKVIDAALDKAKEKMIAAGDFSREVVY